VRRPGNHPAGPGFGHPHPHPDEFAKAGLNKLTPEELTYLEEVLALHQQAPGATSATAAANQPAAPARRFVKSTDKAAAGFGAEQVTHVSQVATEQEMHAHIEGTIESFSGRAVFVLDNGQIWQQRIPDTVYFSPKLVNPRSLSLRASSAIKCSSWTPTGSFSSNASSSPAEAGSPAMTSR